MVGLEQRLNVFMELEQRLNVFSLNHKGGGQLHLYQLDSLQRFHSQLEIHNYTAVSFMKRKRIHHFVDTLEGV